MTFSLKIPAIENWRLPSDDDPRSQQIQENQILAILKAEGGRTVKDFCREHEISEADLDLNVPFGRKRLSCTPNIIGMPQNQPGIVSPDIMQIRLEWQSTNRLSQSWPNIQLGQHVADWKNRFFPSSWAHYETAKPGTFRLAPPEFRADELARDYREMQPMFLSAPPPFETVVKELRSL